MRFQLQHRVPYQHSLRWQLNLDYFQTQGAAAFLSQEVPHDITSNPLFARQLAQTLFASLAALDFDPAEPVRILELGGGLGDFAFYFLKAWEQIVLDSEQPSEQSWAARVEYWLTDISAKTVATWAENPLFQPWIQTGRLRLAQVDALAPETYTPWGEPPSVFAADSFSAVIANYHHCLLPMAFLRYQQGQWYELQSELFAWLAGTPAQPQDLPARQQVLQQLARELQLWRPQDPWLAEAVLPLLPEICQTLVMPAVAQNWQPHLDLKSSLLRWLHDAWLAHSDAADPALSERFQGVLASELHLPLFERGSWQQAQLQDIYVPQPLSLEQLESVQARDVLQQFAQVLDTAVMSLPLASMSSLLRLWPLLRGGGVFCLTDKGFYQLEQMAGSEVPTPSYHGGSLAHMVNFPFLAAWLHKLGCQVLFSADPSALIQTLWAVKESEIPPALAAAFEKHFVSHNQNNLHTLLLQAGVAFYQQQKYADALRYYAAAHHCSPEDDTALLFLASASLALKQPQKALMYLENTSQDSFQTYTRLLLKAEIWFRLHQYPQAISAYEQVLAILPADLPVAGLHRGLLYFNLGEAYFQNQQPQQAWPYLQEAARLLPERPDLQALLGRVAQALTEV